jgi:predicted RNase H-like nuclease (RuvC/YqgF family)
MRLTRRLLELGLVLLPLLLSACQTPPPTPVAPPPAPAPACPEPATPPDVEQLKAVLATAEELRKSLALSLGRNTADLAQAAAQIDAVVTSTDTLGEPLKPLAEQMAARLAEQRRLLDSIDKLTAQLRDAQRRNEQLSEKLEALKAIEQTLPGKPGAPR